MSCEANKLIVIGDVHGKAGWKEVVEEHRNGPDDHVIFLGDYVDAFNVRPEDIIKNMDDIFAYAGDDSECVHLCIGNHDYHYINMGHQYYSGFNDRFSWSYHSIFRDYMELLNIAYFFDVKGVKYLCSHAGVTQTFLDENHIEITEINDFWGTDSHAFGHKRGNPYGDDVYQSPLWVRPNSLIKDAVKGYTQVVGHTWHDRPTKYSIPHDAENSIWVICGEDEENFAIF